jgi:hypothetical protein
MKARHVVQGSIPFLALLLAFAGALALFQQSSAFAQANTTTTRTNNPDGTATVTTTTTYKDGSTTNETNYDKDGHDAGSTRTDVQTKDGETTITITRYDGNGHETGKTITRIDKNGNSTITNYDAQGHETGTITLPRFEYKPDFKLGLDYKFKYSLRDWPKPDSKTQTGANSPPGASGTTRVINDDGTTTITTVMLFKDGWTVTVTKYDKDGHDAGTTQTGIQSKDGTTTTTTTKYDGSGHETGKTIERAAADGSKTVTTYDGEGHETGRTTVPAGQKDAPKSVQSSLEGFVVPDDVHDRQPFTFGVPEGSGQISIQTLNGVVVDSKPPDKYGRVFLASGLAAGAYLVLQGRDGKAVGKVDIQPRPSNVLQLTWEQPHSVEIIHPPETLKMGDPLWLSGRGFSGNCDEMQVNLLASGQTHPVTVLAATEDQLKLAPVNSIKPGAAELKITNQATHQSAPSLPIFVYDLQGHLQQNKLRSGQETAVVFEAQPANVKMALHVTISGKATFAGGRSVVDAVIEHGKLTIPVEANKGAGDFHIDYEGQPKDLPQHAGCSCGCGGTAQPGCAHKGCSCSRASAVSTRREERAGCSCGCGGTAQPACAHKGCVCSKTSAVPETLQPRLENVSPPAKPTGRAGCSCGCGGTAQPRCAHKACGCSKAAAYSGGND